MAKRKLQTKKRAAKKPVAKPADDPVNDDDDYDPVIEEDEIADGEDEPVDDMADDTEPAPPKKGAKKRKLSAGQREVARFVAAFGERGGVLFAAGHSFVQASRIIVAEMRNENAELQREHDRLTAALWEARGEAEPLSAVPARGEPGPGQSPRGSAGAGRHSNLSPGMAKLAAAIELPGKRR